MKFRFNDGSDIVIHHCDGRRDEYIKNENDNFRKYLAEKNKNKETNFVWEPCKKYDETEDYTKPQHYQNGEIDLIESWRLTYPKNEFIAGMEMIADRYVKRHRHKNGVQDLDKAIEYLERLKEYESDE